MAEASRLPIGGDLKVVIVGDGAIGKTCQLQKILHARGELKDKKGNQIQFDIDAEYEATTFDTKTIPDIEYDGKSWNMDLWDTAGQEALETLRRLSYPDADVFLLGFAVNSKISLENIGDKWVPDIRDSVPIANIVLAGFKADMRNDKNLKKDSFTTEMEGQLAAEVNQCKCYIETSAMTGQNCDSLLKLLVAIAVENKRCNVNNRFPNFEAIDELGGFPTPEDVLAGPEVLAARIAAARKPKPEKPRKTHSDPGEEEEEPPTQPKTPKSRRSLKSDDQEEKGCECTLQ